MVNEEIRSIIADINPEAIILDNHAYDNSIVGMTEDNRIVYDFDKMIEEFMLDEECSMEEAQEWVEFNTVRAIGYMGEFRPEIIYPLPYYPELMKEE